MEHYTEPVMCNQTVYEDNNIKAERLWSWDVKGIYEDEETGLMKTLISGDAFNGDGVSTFVRRDGRRLTSLDFDFIDDFKEGLARVFIFDKGYGYIDADGKMAIPMVYEYAKDFHCGKAIVERGGKDYFIDKVGKETLIVSPSGRRYEEICDFAEGLCRVSVLKLRSGDLQYYSDHESAAGIWGYVDESGKEIISPQYIYAYDFCDGIAFVCKGEWMRDEKRDNSRYQTEEELWGAIDKNGNEVIPCIFDDFQSLDEETEIFAVHFGGWENGKWGIINKKGEWVVEPVFEDIDYVYTDGLIAFYNDSKWNDDSLIGVYDIRNQKVVLEPKFSDIGFNCDGTIAGRMFRENTENRVTKLFDRSGNELFPSEYEYIDEFKYGYEVTICDENGRKSGLIDKKGNVLLPCIYNAENGKISYENKRIIFNKDSKQGVTDFDGNVIVPPDYYKIYGLHNPLLTVCVGDKTNYCKGLITHDGITVIPAEWKNILWCSDNYILCCREGHCEMLRLTEL